MVRTAALPTLFLRPAGPDDEAFLAGLYASARADVQAWACGEEEKAAFLLAQYRMQDRSFRDRFPDADCSVIRIEGRDGGRIVTARTPKDVRILDITLLPEFRSRGIGGAIIGSVLEEAARSRLPVRLMVERFNRARSLYERTGFRIVEDAGPHYLMERTHDAVHEKEVTGMLKKLTHETFSKLDDRKFTVHTAAGDAVEVELIQADDLSGRMQTAPEMRKPFSLVFRGPKGRDLAQETYNVKNAGLGSFEIHLVPIVPPRGSDEKWYEAVFN